METNKTMNAADIQAELWEEVKNGWKDSAKWLDYYRKETAYLLKLEDGTVVRIEKPRIKTSFCFGYGYCGVSTEDDRERASDMAEHAQTHAEYFVEKNLEKITEQIAQLKGEQTKDNITGYNAYIYNAYYWKSIKNGAEIIPEVSILCEHDIEKNRDCGETSYIRLSEVDKRKYIDLLERTKKDFEKRLNVYLKKYGTSKLHCWSYLVD